MSKAKQWGRCVLVASAGALAVSGCGQGPSDTLSSDVAGTAATLAVEPVVTRDVQYAVPPKDDDAGWNTATLDVYAPSGAASVPIVVLFHGGPATNSKETQVGLAESLARSGTVVFVPNWGSPTAPPALLDAVGSPAALRYLRLWRREGACAVSYAVAHAGEYGGDPSRLVLVGHSAGANEAALVGLTGPESFPGCAVDESDWSADRLVLWEGDWLLETPGMWDDFGSNLPAAMSAATPWRLLAEAAHGKDVTMVVTDTSRQTMTRCAARDSTGWLPRRDPTGRINEAASEAGALDDGCIDVGESADLLADALTRHGAAVTSLDLHDPASSHSGFSEADQAILVQHVAHLAEAG